MRRPIWGQEGTTLIEVLVTVTIMGIAFTAILGGISTAILASDIHRKQATAQTVLRNLAEFETLAAYTACATTYSTVGFAIPTGYTVSVTPIEYWVQSPPSGGQITGTFSGTCPSPDQGLQRLNLSAASVDGRATERVQILKRR